MCAKFSPGDLNPDPYFSHPISIYICEMTTASKVCDGNNPITLDSCHDNENGKKSY